MTTSLGQTLLVTMALFNQQESVYIFLINHESWNWNLKESVSEIFEKKKEKKKLTLREKTVIELFSKRLIFQFYYETFQTEPGYEANLRPHKSVRLALKIILHSVSFELPLSIIPFG